MAAKTIEANYVAHETKASKMEQADKKATDVPTESEEDEITAVPADFVPIICLNNDGGNEVIFLSEMKNWSASQPS